MVRRAILPGKAWVRLLKQDGEKLVFQIRGKEKRILLDLLNLYPLTPLNHARLSRTTDSERAKSDQQLLEDALGEQREENKKRLRALLQDPRRWDGSGADLKLTLTAAEVEWLLQVLNDVRIGSWIQLDCPDPERGPLPDLTLKTARRYWAMEMAGVYESVLLHAIDPEIS